ncbi:MAG: cysteine desulfuration protein SufE [Alphaproteobacteria bacterium]|nr:cysteine desulfuration protein SufE [Alphaproteobacteria bacterium]
MPGIDADIDALAADFALLSDWEERYGYVIDLGRSLAPLAPEERTEATKVRGCASQVWLVSARNPEDRERLVFRGDSDAHIVRGLIAILLRLFSNRTPRDILSVEPDAAFKRLGLADALTPQRSNGMIAMIERMRRDARDALEPSARG